MRWEWLRWRPKEWKVTLSAAFNWGDGSRDKCLSCSVERRFHERLGHAFVEKEAV